MIQFNFKFTVFLMFIIMILVLVLVMLTSGCITAAKNIGTEVMKTPTPVPTPTPTSIPTPTPTPTPVITVPTLAAHFVDPYQPGERWIGQWFKWNRIDVQGKKDLNGGVTAYRYRWLDYYTWYDDAMGQFYVQQPHEGNRYFVVWVHEEVFGNTSENDPSMWIFDETSFKLQIDGKLYSIEESHNPVNRIREFDKYYDYYDTVTAGPFAWDIQYIGMGAKATGGYTAVRRGWIRMGKGNSVDGYLIFEIPKDTQERDILLSGVFSSFGDAYWRFIFV